jgi:hypothetical protein
MTFSVLLSKNGRDLVGLPQSEDFTMGAIQGRIGWAATILGFRACRRASDTRRFIEQGVSPRSKTARATGMDSPSGAEIRRRSENRATGGTALVSSLFLGGRDSLPSQAAPGPTSSPTGVRNSDKVIVERTGKHHKDYRARLRRLVHESSASCR